MVHYKPQEWNSKVDYKPLNYDSVVHYKQQVCMYVFMYVFIFFHYKLQFNFFCKWKRIGEYSYDGAYLTLSW